MAVSVNYLIPIPRLVSAAFTAGGRLLCTLRPYPGANDWDLRYSTQEDPTHEVAHSINLSASPLGQVPFPDATRVFAQLRAVAANGAISAWSNSQSVTTPTVSYIALKDIKKIIPAATSGAGTQPAGISLASLGLSFIAGDGLVIWAAGGIKATGLGGTQAVGRGAATGWTEPQDHYITGGQGENRGTLRVLTKIADGSEDAVVPLLWSGGAGTVNNYAAYFVASFTIVGTPKSFGSPSGSVTINTPAVVVSVQAGQAANPLISYAFASATHVTSTGLAFTGAPLDINENLPSAAGFSADLKVSLFTVDNAIDVMSASSLDRGNCNALLSGGIEWTE